MGLFVLTLLLWAEGLTLSYAIHLERIFDSTHNAGKTHHGSEAHSHSGSTPPTSTTCVAGGTCSIKKKNNRKFGIFPARQTTVAECQKNFALCLSRAKDSHTADLDNLLSTPRGGHNHHHHHFGEGQGHSHGHGGGHHPPPYGLPLYGWKIIFQVLLTSLNFLSWYVPLNHKSLAENALGLSIANSFSGGVFLSLAFSHLIPECVAGFPNGAHNEVLPYMLILGGYMLIFFVEKVAFDAHGILDHGHHHHHHGVCQQKDLFLPPEEKPNGNVASTTTNPSPLTSGRSAIILLGALAVHSVLEMVSLGLSSNFADSALLSLSIGLHQPAESIALLVAFMKSGLPKSKIIQYLTAFTLMGPIGTATGMAVKEYASPLVDAIMLAIVAGTFVYVGATEVIPEEFEDQSNKWQKFGALVSGMVTIFAITQYTHALGWD